MKSITRFLGILIMIFFVGGIALLFIAVIVGGFQSVKLVDGKIIIGDETVIEGEFFDKVENALEKNINIHIGDSAAFTDDEQVWQGNVDKTKVAGSSVEKWNLELGGCEFVVKSSGDESYYVEYRGKGKSQAYTKGDELFVKALDSSDISLGKEENCFILYVPQSAEIDSAEIKLGAGKALVSDFCAEELKVQVGAGELIMDDVLLEKAKVEVGAGRCAIIGEITDELKAECAMGSIDLMLQGEEEDFDYKIEAVSGSVSIGGQLYSGLAKEKKIDNDADKEMKLNCSMGSIQVNFE